MTTPYLSPLQQAFALVQQGQPQAAENWLLEKAREAVNHWGPTSVHYAAAQDDLGGLFLSLGKLAEAADACRRACAVPIPNHAEWVPGHITRLDHGTLALELAGAIEEADALHQQALAVRKDFYGCTHPAFAAGQETYARMLFRHQKLVKALTVIEEAIETFWVNKQQQLASALLLRAEILRGAGQPIPPFQGLEELPDLMIEALAETALQRAVESPPLNRKVVQDLLILIQERLGLNHPLWGQLRPLSTS